VTPVTVAVCDYGAGNVRSVAAAFRRVGIEPRVTSDPRSVTEAEVAVLPGVGAARRAMAHLLSTGVAEALHERAAAHRPTLGICLGLQLALEESEEDGGVPALGLAPGRAIRLKSGRIPRIGWAPVEPYNTAFYFAHSYAADSDARSATSEGFTAEIRWGSFVGVQFHPEKSGSAGHRYLSRYLAEVTG
jgi:imidazole glycerol-phosphate synthase subunit HisH